VTPTATCGGTFGQSNALATGPAANSSLTGSVTLYLNQFQSSASEPTTLLNITLGVSEGTSFEAGVYSDNGNVPGNLLQETGPQTIISVQGDTTAPLNMPVILTANTPYWLAFITDASYLYNSTVPSTSPNWAFYSNATFGSLPSSLSSSPNTTIATVTSNSSSPVSEFNIYGTTCP
jgi:hypothetical protein